MAPTPVTFSSMSDLWQSRYQAARGGGSDVPDLRKTDDFIQNKSESELVYEYLSPLGESFLSLIKGLSAGASSAERAVQSVVCFFPKFFRVETISQLPETTAGQLSDVIDETHFLGLASHLILTHHTHRHRIASLDRNQFYSKFSEVSAIADVEMRPYNKNLNGMPEAVFRQQFGESVEPLLKNELKVGFWKMG